MQIRRVLCATAALSAATLASAQLPDARMMLNPALNDLGGQDRTSFVLTGTETDGRRTWSFASRVSVQRVTTRTGFTTFLELVSYREGRLVQRIVADGARVSVYEPQSHTYWQFAYGQRQNAETMMLDTVRRAVRGYDDMLLHLVRFAHLARVEGDGAAARWLPYYPQATVAVDDLTIRASTMTPRPTRTTYNLTDNGSGDLRLNGVSYAGAHSREGIRLNVDWTIQIFNNELVPATLFTFDPGDARPTTVTLRQSGGG
mgnify:CR=1 FL=1